MRLKIKCLQLSVFSCVYIVCYDFILAFPKTISRLHNKPRENSKGRICLKKKNIPILFIGVHRREDLFFAEYRQKKKGTAQVLLERPICETFLEICGTHNLSNKTIYVAPVFNFYGHIVFNIIFSSATETERKVKNRVRFGEILVRKAFNA